MADFSDFNRLAWYYQGLIVVGVAGGLLALVWWQVLTPLQAEVDTKQGQLDELNQEIAVAAQRQLQLAQIKADALELQQELDDLKPILPSERETDDVLRQVEAAARVSSLRIRRVSTSLQGTWHRRSTHDPVYGSRGTRRTTLRMFSVTQGKTRCSASDM